LAHVHETKTDRTSFNLPHRFHQTPHLPLGDKMGKDRGTQQLAINKHGVLTNEHRGLLL
jgi:hypothetical protein